MAVVVVVESDLVGLPPHAGQRLGVADVLHQRVPSPRQLLDRMYFHVVGNTNGHQDADDDQRHSHLDKRETRLRGAWHPSCMEIGRIEALMGASIVPLSSSS